MLVFQVVSYKSYTIILFLCVFLLFYWVSSFFCKLTLISFTKTNADAGLFLETFFSMWLIAVSYKKNYK